MSRAEIRRKFDEIVAFAEVDKFLDTPVKHYSSGMYVRLAFAVAAHLEPEILVVDEVLAVGDAQFQKKCFGKMEDVGKEGRTVLFVSHNMGMISHLCRQVFLLNNGLIVKSGDAEEVISYYMKSVKIGGEKCYKYEGSGNKTREIYILEVSTVDNNSNNVSDYNISDPVILNIHLKINILLKDVMVGIAVKDQRGRKVFTTQRPLSSFELNGGDCSLALQIRIPANFLVPGTYSFEIGLHIPNIQIVDLLDEVCMFTIMETGSEFYMYEGVDQGCVFAKCEWQVQAIKY